MPYSRRSMSKRPIVSEKHEFTWSNLGQNASTVQSLIIIKGVEAGGVDTSTPEEVIIGSKIMGVYIEMNLNGVDNSGAVQVFHWAVIRTNKTTFLPWTPPVTTQRINLPYSKRYGNAS